MKRYGVGPYACFGCAAACGNRVRIDKGEYAPVAGHGAEYETVAGFGSLCLNDNVESILKANDICNQYGLDTISTSCAVAFAIEAFERGLITKRDTGGLELAWGNHRAIVGVTGLIARCEGLGQLLGRGVREAARVIGRNAQEFAIHSKGLEVPMHDPRAEHDMALGYATSTRGACHLNSFSYMLAYGRKVPDLGYERPPDCRHPDGMAKVTRQFQEWMALFDALGICKFMLTDEFGPRRMARWVRYVTGWRYTLPRFMRVGERLFNLKRLYSARFGISRKDDTLPSRLLTWARPSGDAKGLRPHLPQMLGEFYKLRGWSEDGVPERRTLEKLGLGQYVTQSPARQGGGRQERVPGIT